MTVAAATNPPDHPDAAAGGLPLAALFVPRPIAFVIADSRLREEDSATRGGLHPESSPPANAPLGYAGLAGAIPITAIYASPPSVWVFSLNKKERGAQPGAPHTIGPFLPSVFYYVRPRSFGLPHPPAPAPTPTGRWSSSHGHRLIAGSTSRPGKPGPRSHTGSRALRLLQPSRFSDDESTGGSALATPASGTRSAPAVQRNIPSACTPSRHTSDSPQGRHHTASIVRNPSLAPAPASPRSNRAPLRFLIPPSARLLDSSWVPVDTTPGEAPCHRPPTACPGFPAGVPVPPLLSQPVCIIP